MHVNNIGSHGTTIAASTIADSIALYGCWYSTSHAVLALLTHINACSAHVLTLFWGLHQLVVLMREKLVQQFYSEPLPYHQPVHHIM